MKLCIDSCCVCTQASDTLDLRAEKGHLWFSSKTAMHVQRALAEPAVATGHDTRGAVAALFLILAATKMMVHEVKLDSFPCGMSQKIASHYF